MNKYQVGVGLMEVLVALLILSIGVLGFILLQYRAIEATSESGSRIQAINLARDLAERIRVNRGEEAMYESQLNTPTNQRESTKNCFTEGCTANQLADFDVAQVVNKARNMGMVVNYINCQANQDNRKCVYVAWGDTAPTDGEEKDGHCTTGTTYDPDSTCLIMEVY